MGAALDLALQPSGPKRRDFAAFTAVIDAAEDVGLAPYSAGMPRRTDFFSLFREVYRPTFPVLQDLVNVCWDHGFGPDDPISWADFRDFFAPNLPGGRFRLGYYLGVTARNAYADHQLTRATYTDLLRALWDDPRIRSSVRRHTLFETIDVERDGAVGTAVDDHGHVYLHFRKPPQERDTT